MPASLEVVSKPQIRFKGKASRGLKTERTRQYVSISIRGTTQPLGLRWGFETTSNVERTILQSISSVNRLFLLREKKFDFKTGFSYLS